MSKKESNITKALKKLAGVRATANDGDRLPPIPPTKVFKSSKKDKRDNPKHKNRDDDSE